MSLSQHHHEHLKIVHADFQMACQRLQQVVTDPDKQHLLPGAIADANESLAAILNCAGAGNPDIIKALSAGKRTTREVSQPANIVDTRRDPFAFAQ